MAKKFNKYKLKDSYVKSLKEFVSDLPDEHKKHISDGNDTIGKKD